MCVHCTIYIYFSVFHAERPYFCMNISNNLWKWGFSHIKEKVNLRFCMFSLAPILPPPPSLISEYAPVHFATSLNHIFPTSTFLAMDKKDLNVLGLMSELAKPPLNEMLPLSLLDQHTCSTPPHYGRLTKCFGFANSNLNMGRGIGREGTVFFFFKLLLVLYFFVKIIPCIP